MLCLSEDDLSKLRSPVKAVRVGDETWLIPPSGHLTGPASFSASDWSSLPTHAACKSAPSLFFPKQSTSRDVQSMSLYLKAPLAKRIAYIYRRLSQWIANCNVVICKKKEPILFKASLVTRTIPTPSLEELPISLKASLGSSTLLSATSKKTASSSRTQELEVLKVCQCSIPLSDPSSSDAYRLELVIGA